MAILLQDALQATEALRGDPLLYVLITFMGAAVIALGGTVAFLFKKNSSLQETNTDLAKAGTEAIASITPIIQYMQAEQKEALGRFERTVEKAASDIKSHINVLKGIGS